MILNPLFENQSLKSEFPLRNLDLSQIWQPTPDDQELENGQLRHLLDGVEKYQECPYREELEAQGYKFPPIDPCIDPYNDWLRFEHWLAGKTIWRKLRDFLLKNFLE